MKLQGTKDWSNMEPVHQKNLFTYIFKFYVRPQISIILFFQNLFF